MSRRNDIRRDVDVCAPTVPCHNLEIFDLELQFELYFLCARSPDRAEAPGEVSFEKVKFQYFMHPESISVTYYIKDFS